MMTAYGCEVKLSPASSALARIRLRTNGWSQSRHGRGTQVDTRKRTEEKDRNGVEERWGREIERGEYQRGDCYKPDPSFFSHLLVGLAEVGDCLDALKAVALQKLLTPLPGGRVLQQHGEPLAAQGPLLLLLNVPNVGQPQQD